LHHVPAGSMLLRIFNPTSHNVTALTFRKTGPICRFDHHKEADPPAHDPDRGIIYGAWTLRACLVEVFGDTRIVQPGEYQVAALTITRELRLLDLRGGNAMRAGTVAAICKDSRRSDSQAWSRFFYDTEYEYGRLDGLIWGNAHNDEDAIALYERAQDGVTCGAADIVPLSDEALRFEIQTSAAETGMLVEPY
jgi:hypothetical protein